jgi:hypothetical protein
MTLFQQDELQYLVDNVNLVNKKWPKTIYDKGWIYGLWYCSTSFQKAIYYGQYPSTFVKRILGMFPNHRMLHLCCGRCKIAGAVNVDIHKLPEVDIVANVESLPDILKGSKFDVVLIDPPYSEEDSKRYKVPRLINARRVMKESKDCLRGGGFLLWLDEKYPSYRRKEWRLVGLIGIVTGFERRTRVLSIFKSL